VADRDIKQYLSALFSGRKDVVQMLFKSRIEELIARSFQDMLDAERRLILTEIGRNWDFYYGNQDIEKYFKKYRGEDEEEYADKEKPFFNYTRLVIDEYIKGVMSLGFKTIFDDPKLQSWWDDFITNFNFKNFMKMVQRISELSYDCLVVPRWDKDRKQVYYEEVRGEYVKYFPDVNNPKRIGSIAIVYLYDSGIASADGSSLIKRVELWSHERIQVVEYSKVLQKRRVLYNQENPYKDEDGFAVIPIAKFRPENDDNSFFGTGNAGDISAINMYYNNVWMNLVRLVVHQSFSVLFLKSSTQFKVEIAPTRFLKTTDPDATASYLTPGAKIEEVRKVREDFRNELLDISRVPVTVLAGPHGKSPQSGFSLQVKRMPIEYVWAEKRGNYEDSVKDLIRYTRIVESTHVNQTPKLKKKPTIKVPWNLMQTPVEAQTQQAQDAFELETGLTSQIELYMRKHKVDREAAKLGVMRNLKEKEKINEALAGMETEKAEDGEDFIGKLDRAFKTKPVKKPVGRKVKE
jgi:hypothetical protein